MLSNGEKRRRSQVKKLAEVDRLLKQRIKVESMEPTIADLVKGKREYDKKYGAWVSELLKYKEMVEKFERKK